MTSSDYQASAAADWLAEQSAAALRALACALTAAEHEGAEPPDAQQCREVLAMLEVLSSDLAIVLDGVLAALVHERAASPLSDADTADLIGLHRQVEAASGCAAELTGHLGRVRAAAGSLGPDPGAEG